MAEKKFDDLFEQEAPSNPEKVITADFYCDVLEKKKQPADVVQNTFFNA